MTIAGNEFLETLVVAISELLANGLEEIFGPGIRRIVLGSATWADLGAFLCLLLIAFLLHGLAAYLMKRKIRQVQQAGEAVKLRAQLAQALPKPIYLLIWLAGLYFAVMPLLLKLPSPEGIYPTHQILNTIVYLGLFVVLFWLLFRFSKILESHLLSWAEKAESMLEKMILPLLARGLRVAVPVVAIILIQPMIGVPEDYASVLGKISSILIIGLVGWILFEVVRLGEKAVLAKYDISAADNFQARKVYTQVHVLSKTLFVVIAIFTAASVLMLFDEVRRLGTSLLASAGVIGIIVGFAAQRTISNLFAGFQLAITQPIRLDDVVIVEGEWGRVEEITLTYVVVHIWDDRRLIVPLSHFIEKPFQNWTRVSATLLGSVFLWVDYTLPLDEVRKVTEEILMRSTLWDKRFWNLQVTDANERAMQIRVLATAADSSKAWDLRCEVREQLILFIQKHHPNHLPRIRADLSPPARNILGSQKPDLTVHPQSHD